MARYRRARGRRFGVRRGRRRRGRGRRRRVGFGGFYRNRVGVRM